MTSQKCLVGIWSRGGGGGGLVLGLTLGLSTLDWYSAWNCVPSKGVSNCSKVKKSEGLLLTNEVGVILQFEDLHALACLVLSDKMQTSGL